MKIAILLPGQPRFTGDFDLLLKNLKGYDQADWFITITNHNHDKNKFKDHKNIDILESWTEFDLDWARNKISENLPPNNTIRKIEISDSHTHQWPEVKNLHELREDWANIIFMMYYNVYAANQLRLEYEQETNTTYDAVIRIRSDIGISEEFDVSKLTIEPNTIYMANNEWHGMGPYRCNDQMAIGDSDSVNVYCDLVRWMKLHNDRGVSFHPETLLGFHLVEKQIKMIHGGYNIGLRKFPIDVARWS